MWYLPVCISPHSCAIHLRSHETKTSSTLSETHPSSTTSKSKCGFLHWRKNFYLNLPVNHQNDRVWSSGRLVAEGAKFAKHVMVSAGVCFSGKGKLHFIPDKAKVNAKLYVETLLPKVVQDCRYIIYFAVWLHLSTGRRTCTRGKAGSRLDCYQLQWIHW